MSEDQKNLLWRAAAIGLAVLVIASIMDGCNNGGDNKAWAIGTSLMCYVQLITAMAVAILGGRLTWIGMLRAGWAKPEDNTGGKDKGLTGRALALCVVGGLVSGWLFSFATKGIFPSGNECALVQGADDGYGGDDYGYDRR